MSSPADDAFRSCLKSRWSWYNDCLSVSTLSWCNPSLAVCFMRDRRAFWRARSLRDGRSQQWEAARAGIAGRVEGSSSRSCHRCPAISLRVCNAQLSHMKTPRDRKPWTCLLVNEKNCGVGFEWSSASTKITRRRQSCHASSTVFRVRKLNGFSWGNFHGSKSLHETKLSEISQWQKYFSELKISDPRISCSLNGVGRSFLKVVWVTEPGYASETWTSVELTDFLLTQLGSYRHVLAREFEYQL